MLFILNWFFFLFEFCGEQLVVFEIFVFQRNTEGISAIKTMYFEGRSTIFFAVPACSRYHIRTEMALIFCLGGQYGLVYIHIQCSYSYIIYKILVYSTKCFVKENAL